MSFLELGLTENTLRAVAAQGYTQPTPIQTQAIPPLLAGHDLLGCAQTGTGKTAAFTLPLLHRLLHSDLASKAQRRRPIRALILAPTRELAAQIGESLQAYGQYTGLRHTVVFGGVGQQPQVRALRHGVDILVATPGRLLDLMNQGHIVLAAVEIFVLDEGDRMLDLGFLPDVRRVIAHLPARRQTLLFSATMPAAIEQLAASILRNPTQVRIAPVRETTALIEQSVVFVPRAQKTEALTRLLTTRAVTRALVFTRTKHGADRVAKQLIREGIRAGVIHGNKSQSARQRTLADFKSNHTPVLVATDLAARGIDVEGISHVLNYDLPHEPETYVHRIGRTGRAGATGIAVSLCDQEERKLLLAIERLLRRTLAVDRELGREPRTVAPTAERAPAKHAPAAGKQRSWAGKPRPGERKPRPYGKQKRRAYQGL